MPALVVAVVAIIALVVVVVVDDDGDQPRADVPAPTTTTRRTTTTAAGSSIAPSSTAAPASSTTTSTIPTGPTDTDQAVWPDASGSLRFDDPRSVTRRFAIDYVGFVDPVVGEFRQGDQRSGEVEIRAEVGAPVTTVLLRQLGPAASWWVIGTATADIEVDEPTSLETIADPVRLRGRARAFEGHVAVEIRADGVAAPIATGFVLGRGDGVLGPFDASLDYERPATGLGAVLFLTRSAKDGRMWQAAVVRVRFPRDE